MGLLGEAELASSEPATQEIELVGEGTLLPGADIDVHLVERVLPRPPAFATARRAACGGVMLSQVPA